MWQSRLSESREHKSKHSPVDKNIKPRFQQQQQQPQSKQINSIHYLPAWCSYRIAKWMMLRLLAAMYWVAFYGAYHQNEGLMGSNGLIPAAQYMQYLRQQQQHQMVSNQGAFNPWYGFVQHPTIFWWIEWNDTTMYAVIEAGLVLSTVALVLGVNSWLIQLLLWLLDFSLVTAAGGNSFYSYGWESQLLETGFLAIFLCELPHFNDRGRLQFALWESSATTTMPATHQPSPIILWLFQWLSFRISIGAGLIKIRGSSCWTNRTCLHYHFETQPIPSPLSFFYHFLPKSIQSSMVDTDFWVQLYTSWMVLFPVSLARRSVLVRIVLRLGGWIQTGFMVGIALSGNFSYLNHLTIIPSLACLDDACWPMSWQRRQAEQHGRGTALVEGTATDTTEGLDDIATATSNSNHPQYVAIVPPASGCGVFTRRSLIDIPLLILIGYLSWPVVSNLLQLNGQGRQLMNASFDSFRLVNTYGAFGSVGTVRYEAIVQISDDGVHWTELEFPCKPGTVTRCPCFCAPYHYRVDWNIWFLGFKPHASYLRQREGWLLNLLMKIMTVPSSDVKLNHHQRPWLHLLDRSTAKYLEHSYYKQGKAPRYAKVDMYHYRMSNALWTLLWQAVVERRGTITWWNRRFEENLIPPVSFDQPKGRLEVAGLIASNHKAPA